MRVPASFSLLTLVVSAAPALAAELPPGFVRLAEIAILFALVLVKPLVTFSWFGAGSATEVDYLTDMASMPQIMDDAYLGLIAMPNATLAGAPIIGIIETTWSDT